MKFTSIPDTFSSYREPLLYAFETGSSTPRDVELKIINHTTGEEIGRKRLYNVTSGEVDIAPYLRSAQQPSLPQRVEQTGEVEISATIRVVVEALGVRSTLRSFVAAKIDRDAYFMLLTEQQMHRTMQHDEFDIISYFSWSDILVTFDVEYIGNGTEHITIEPASGGQRAVAVTARGRERVENIRVTILVDGEPTSCIEYEIKQNLCGARRVAWLNGSLSPELYTFPLRKSVLIESTRRHMASIWGSEAAEVESSNQLKLLSAYEPEKQLNALSEILSSPRVWLVEGADVKSVELHTERVLLSPTEGMGIIEIDLQAAEEGVKLW